MATLPRSKNLPVSWNAAQARGRAWGDGETRKGHEGLVCMLWTFRMIGRAGGAAEAEDTGRGSKSVPLYKHYIKILNLWCNKKRVLKERESEEARGKAGEKERERVKREARGGECQHACWKGTWHVIGFGFRLFFWVRLCCGERACWEKWKRIKENAHNENWTKRGSSKKETFSYISHRDTQWHKRPQKKKKHSTPEWPVSMIYRTGQTRLSTPRLNDLSTKKKENNINGNCSLSPRFNDNKGMAQLGGCHCSKG